MTTNMWQCEGPNPGQWYIIVRVYTRKQYCVSITYKNSFVRSRVGQQHGGLALWPVTRTRRRWRSAWQPVVELRSMVGITRSGSKCRSVNKHWRQQWWGGQSASVPTRVDTENTCRHWEHMRAPESKRWSAAKKTGTGNCEDWQRQQDNIVIWQSGHQFSQEQDFTTQHQSCMSEHYLQIWGWLSC